MSFNRLNYDTCTYVHNLRQSVGSADYFLGTPMPHCQPCFSTDPQLRVGTGGTQSWPGSACPGKPLVDVSSELFGITRSATNCPTAKYLPDPTFCANPATLKDCQSALPAENTRISNPSCTLRGTGWNRWEWLCQNPQENAFVPFDFNIDNRLIAKDTHRPCLPDPVDQSLALPPACMDAPALSPEYQPTCGKVADNLPSVAWRSCDAIRNY